MNSYAPRMQLSPGSRLGSLTLVAFLHLLLILALISAFAVTVIKQQSLPSTRLIDIITTIPPVEQEEVRPLETAQEPSGGGSPPPSPAAPAPSRNSAPVPDSTVAPLAPPTPTITGPAANGRPGSGSSAGAGIGTGAGSGSGVGPGSGGGSGVAVRARRTKGYISSEDYPKGPLRAKIEGTTGVELTISAAGRVTGCSVVKSSGNSELDSTVCRLTQQRFQFQPAKDRSGTPVADRKKEYFTWVLPR